MAVRRVDEHRAALRRRSNAVYARLHLHGAGHETLRGRTVGLLGLGRIGRETARLLQAFGPRLVAFDPYVSPRVARALGVELVSLLAAARASRRSWSSRRRSPTRRAGCSAARRSRGCRDGATVVNVARGGIVDLDALTREVRSGRLRCALDVTDPRRAAAARATRCAGCAGPCSRRTWARRRATCGGRWPTSCSTTSSASSRAGACRRASRRAMLDRMT